jgi:hypothetical protein
MPAEVDYAEILPWLGFMLSGAAGMIWYSYWIQKKGYGMAKEKEAFEKKPQHTVEEKRRLKDWIKQMTLDNNLAVFGTLIITLSFLILGVELLKPKGLVPEENKVAEVLGQLLGSIWGPVGFWFMIVGVFIGFWDTVLSDQDGFGRMFAGGVRHLLKPEWQGRKWADEMVLKKFFVITVVTILPIILYLMVGEPVQLLKIAGFIEAAHIPVLVALVLILNLKTLPKDLKPSLFTIIMTGIAGAFFAVFAVIYVLQIAGLVTLQ